MTNWLLVFLGGGIGSILRYFISIHLNRSGQSFFLPIGTFVTNLLACFILGVLIQKQISPQSNDNYHLLLAIGFCGGFSTFSTLAFEIYQYIQKDQLHYGIIYATLSVVLGTIIMILGMKTNS